MSQTVDRLPGIVYGCQKFNILLHLFVAWVRAKARGIGLGTRSRDIVLRI